MRKNAESGRHPSRISAGAVSRERSCLGSDVVDWQIDGQDVSVGSLGKPECVVWWKDSF